MGLTQDELLDNVKIQELLTQHAAEPLQVNSLVENGKNCGQMIKVQNFQALIDNNYKHYSEKVLNIKVAQEESEMSVSNSQYWSV